MIKKIIYFYILSDPEQRSKTERIIIDSITNVGDKRDRCARSYFNEKIVSKIGVSIIEMKNVFQTYLNEYPLESEQQRVLKEIINYTDTNVIDDELIGKIFIKCITSMTNDNQCTAKFIVYQYRYG